MADSALKNEGDKIALGEQFGVEGVTGNVTGLHVHIDMQNYVNNGNKWIYSARDPSLWNVVYFNPSEYMGFPNILGISVYYDGSYVPPQPPILPKNKANKWLVIKAKKVFIKR